jgi:sec-independent protein translocase protein TatA
VVVVLNNFYVKIWENTLKFGVKSLFLNCIYSNSQYLMKFANINLNKIFMETIFLFNFVGPEMLVVFFAILLLFGGKKIPELMKGLGKGIKEFNSARASVEKELKEGMKEEEKA